MSTKNLKKAKLTKRQASQFLTTLADLLNAGFSLKTAITFMQVLMPKQQSQLNEVANRLTKNPLLAESLSGLGFSKTVLTQLKIAQEYGQLNIHLKQLAHLLAQQVRFQSKLQQLLLYPLCLLFMLAGLIIAMKQLFSSEQTLPLLGKTAWIIIVTLILVLSALFFWFQKQSAFRKAELLTHTFFTKKIATCYYTLLLSSEWQMMLASGLDIQKIISVLAGRTQEPLMKETAIRLNDSFSAGRSLAQGLHAISYLKPTFALIFQKGSTPEQLLIELETYKKWQYQQLINALNRLLILIQPLLFMLIALIILGMYLRLLLPIYQTIEGMS